MRLTSDILNCSKGDEIAVEKAANSIESDPGNGISGMGFKDKSSLGDSVIGGSLVA